MGRGVSLKKLRNRQEPVVTISDSPFTKERNIIMIIRPKPKHAWLIALLTSLSMGYGTTTLAEGQVTPLAAEHINISISANLAPLNVPDSIQAPDDVANLFGALASGYQIYRCEANAEGRYRWALKSPDAALYDDQGNTFGSHYAGPVWQSNDGSHIVGEVIAKVASPNDANAVAWLLVRVKARRGDGIFNNITYVNRVNTEGGQAPQDTCNETRLGDEYRARYSAVYYFYGQP